MSLIICPLCNVMHGGGCINGVVINGELVRPPQPAVPICKDCDRPVTFCAGTHSHACQLLAEKKAAREKNV
jgi:hypothetical protein